MRKKFMKAAFGTVMAAAVVPMTAMTAFAADEGHATLTAEGDSTVIPIYADVDKAEDTTTGDVISVDVSWSNTRVKAESGANVYRWDPDQLKYVLEKESDEVTETAAGKADITITNRSNVDIDYTVEVTADSKFTEENASEKTGSIATVATTIGADAAASANSAEYTADIRLGEGVNLTEAQDGYQLGSYVVTIGKGKEEAEPLSLKKMFTPGVETTFTFTEYAPDSEKKSIVPQGTHELVFTCPEFDSTVNSIQNIACYLDGESATCKFDCALDGAGGILCDYSIKVDDYAYITLAVYEHDGKVDEWTQYRSTYVQDVTIEVDGTDYTSDFEVFDA